ncbi:peptidyl-glycine alpha-amidating monooxygenase B isoform X4 [Electrophorus electricus]|uniref:peptidyl-glycine alpha-amidating monooxygenase B isoform X4 n=1 Tax=Electrophorus electricus TaxID=8005 RepID=UPI0015D0A49D|nr:peptidyl-glycine alpha-amidating monooxygenase B isoform X4 [Electrophorus electricus]
MGFLVSCILVMALICQSHSHSGSPQARIKRYQETPWSDPNDCTQPRQPLIMSNPFNFSVDIRMPGVLPTSSDSYYCVAVPVPTSREAYIVDFVPHASMDTAHHMLLYGCRAPYSTKGFWDCGTEQGTCQDEAKIMYAWARNAPPTNLPKDVGFKVGGDTQITYFVLQLHYGDVNSFRDHHRDCSGLTLRMTSKPQPYVAGMYLMMSLDTVIPPGKTVTNADIACTYLSYPMYPFAFRTHTHRLGKVVSGYRIRNGQWMLIGRQSPQLPQAFYPVSNAIDVRYGDTLAARCVFTGEGRTGKTRIGGTSNDEMCNFYIMYYMDNKHAVPYMDCMDHGTSGLFRGIPAEASVPIPVSPDKLVSMVHGSAHRDGEDDSELKQPKRDEEEVPDQGAHLEEKAGWPEVQLQLGQVSGLALDSSENLIIFHRGDHRWGVNSFDSNAIYQQKALGPIQQSTILVVDPVKGSVLKASGRNMFYLPHGITTDKDNNYWVTDVALHQVLKLSRDGKDTLLLTLGEAFVPGSDHGHFCQPTDVAVDPDTGNVYISDGYCNARVLKFSPEGKYLTHWGAGYLDRRRRGPFRIPHSLAFAPDKRELLVADRENGRVQCFMADTGEFVKEIKKDEFGGEVFAVAYAPVHSGLIYVVNGESPYGNFAPLQGFMLNYSTKEILDTFAPETQKFKMPHDIVVAKDGSVFVGDASSDSVLKFVPSESVLYFTPSLLSEAEHRSVKKGGIEVQEIEETETFVQANLKPIQKSASQSAEAAVLKLPATVQEEGVLAQHSSTPEEKEKSSSTGASAAQGLSPAVLTTLLLLLPLLLVIAVGAFVRWKKGRMYGDGHEVKLEPSGSSGGILGKLRGKAAGTLNLGNFFATHKGYTRQGFDRLSTEGSDLEKDDEDATDSENEEYSAPPPPGISSQ